MTFRMVSQDLLGTRHLVGDDTLGLGINGCCRLLGIWLCEAVVVPAGGVVEGDILEFLAHAVVSHHGVRLFGCALEVIEGAGRGLLEEELLCCTTAQ